MAMAAVLRTNYLPILSSSEYKQRGTAGHGKHIIYTTHMHRNEVSITVHS